MRNRNWKKIGGRLLAGALAFACVCAAGNIPVKAAEAKAASETSAVEQIWQEVVEEYGLEQEETELVYQTDAMGRSTQVPEAVKSETVDENGNVAVTYYVPYVMDEEEDELVNSFELVQRRNYSGEHKYPSSNLIFSYTALYNTKRQPANIGYMTFFNPVGLSASYRLTGSGEVVLITQLNGIYDIVCNLYAAPNCLEVSEPEPAYRNYHMSAQFSAASPTPGTTYMGTISNMPSGYLAYCLGSQSGYIQFSFSYKNSKGTLKSGTTSQLLIEHK